MSLSLSALVLLKELLDTKTESFCLIISNNNSCWWKMHNMVLLFIISWAMGFLSLNISLKWRKIKNFHSNVYVTNHGNDLSLETLRSALKSFPFYLVAHTCFSPTFLAHLICIFKLPNSQQWLLIILFLLSGNKTSEVIAKKKKEKSTY